MQMNKKIVRSKDIYNELCAWIIQGKYKEGEQLPARREMEEIFSTTPNTIHKAFENLISNGYVTVKPNKGTFVSKYLPNLYNYAVLIRSREDSPGWVNYWNVIRHVSEELRETSPFRFSLLSGIDKDYERARFKKLISAMESNVYGGLIFLFDPAIVKDTPLLNNKSIPKVGLGEHHYQGIPSLCNDNRVFVSKALGYLKERKRKRIAIIMPAGAKTESVQHFIASVKGIGAVTDDYMIQSINHSHLEWGKNLIHLLLKTEKNQRPDGLIITDDNFIDPISEGILKTGIQVGRDIDIVAHANFPLLRPAILPMKRLGFNVRHTINVALELMSAQRQGRKFPEKVLIIPVFEGETNQPVSFTGNS